MGNRWEDILITIFDIFLVIADFTILVLLVAGFMGVW